MWPRTLPAAAMVLGVGALAAGCGRAAPAEIPTPTLAQASVAATIGTPAASGTLKDWPEFGLDAQRSDVSEAATGITAANVTRLRSSSISLPGTVDSSPIYLHQVKVAGSERSVVIVTTTYGRTIALDANSARILWVFTPPGYSGWAGSAQITTASPIADPDRESVYATSPNGLVHKLSLSSGKEASSGRWPVRVTLEPRHEKLAAALNLDGPYIVATSGGYIGDGPPYQGHVVLIRRANGSVAAVFNALCSERRTLIYPSSCHSSDAAILSRAGAVVEPGSGRILIDTGNGPWNGTSDFGDSVLELTLAGLHLRQSFTPVDQGQLNSSDGDLGSSGPVLLGSDRVVVAGKDGILRVLDQSRLDGHAPSAGDRGKLGGEVQRAAVPGGGELFSAPAVWRQGDRTTMFVSDEHGTTAYVLRRGRLLRAWENANPGTSPVMAGGLLYVYDLSAGGIYVYRPSSPRPVTKLAGRSGHWNSPVVVDGHVIEPEGNGNDHAQTGTIEIFSLT